MQKHIYIYIYTYIRLTPRTRGGSDAWEGALAAREQECPYSYLDLLSLYIIIIIIYIIAYPIVALC